MRIVNNLINEKWKWGEINKDSETNRTFDFVIIIIPNVCKQWLEPLFIYTGGHEPVVSNKVKSSISCFYCTLKSNGIRMDK